MPTLIWGYEYCTVGHDDVGAPVSRERMMKSSDPLSFLFGGIGDARHLLVIIITVRAL